MALYHHDARDYQVAAGAAADKARRRLEEQIAKGQGALEATIARMQAEQPRDIVAPRGALRFWSSEFDGEAGDDGEAMDYHGVAIQAGDDHLAGLHSHALGQVSKTLGIPVKYIRALEETGEPWSADLLAHNLNQLNAHNNPRERFLLREVDGEVRGFLSDRFRRLDSGPILESFAAACQSVGAVPVGSHCGDTRWHIKMLLPTIYEPVENEVVAFGVTLQNSDYGAGKLSLKMHMLRLWCTNFAIREEALGQIHLGGRLADDIAWSEETRRLDTEASASKVTDAVNSKLGEDAIAREIRLIQIADEEGIDASQNLTKLQRKGLISKADSAEATEIYNSADIETLPPGNTMWRLSNALSALANVRRDEGDEPRAVELEEAAGQVLTDLGKRRGLDKEAA